MTAFDLRVKQDNACSIIGIERKGQPIELTSGWPEKKKPGAMPGFFV
jgi:hypothetical protein